MFEHDQLARKFIRALRGSRSQLAFSRRLGFKSNVLAKWESGRRVPGAKVILQACRKSGIDVRAAFSSFHHPTSNHVQQLTDASLSRWLAAQRGDQPLKAVAQRSRLSRYQVTRCLSGHTHPSLPVFFALVDTMTGRLPEFVATLVDLEGMPELQDAFAMQEGARTCAYAHPWSSAVLAVLDACPVERLGNHADTVSSISKRLRISEEVTRTSVTALQHAGVLNERLEVVASLATNTRNDPTRAAALRRHWAEVACQRLGSPSEHDLFSFNIFAVSEEDYEEIRRLQVDFYRRIQALVRESKDSDTAALMNMHLIRW